jgi:Zn-dependent metalloprotease
MKSKLTTIAFVILTKFGFGQYEEYQFLLTPYLSAPIESGFFYFNTPNNIQAGSLYQTYKLNAPDLDNDMFLIDTHVDSLAGLTHYKYQQLYKNIPVEGAGCIEHYDTYRSLLFINSKIADSIISNGRPDIADSVAIRNLIDEQIHGEGYTFAWESEEWEQQIRLDRADSNATWYPEAELIFAIDTMKNMTMVIEGSRYTLAYKIPVKIIAPIFETFIYYVDANTGAILKVRSASVCNGPANIYGYGSKTIDTQYQGGFQNNYFLKTNNETREIHTKKNPNGDTAWWLLDNTTDDDDDWGSTYQTETSTHYHVSTSWDYFRLLFGRTGQNNESREIRVRTQLNEINAYFDYNDGGPNELTFGKENGWDFGLEPAIVGHEYTHGVTHHSSNLQPEYESGALNESYSDIFGIMVQSVMLDGGSTDWIIGNFIPISVQRSLEDPNSLGVSYDAFGNLQTGQPDTYSGDFWYSGDEDDGGVHVNSGVQNKWFYILSTGENGQNDLLDYYNVDGIGKSKASHISYYALTSILMSSSQYTDSRQATITAAKILFGECSVEHQATIDAWHAVGIGEENTCTYTASLQDIKESDFLVYPNPANQFLTIEVPYKAEENIQIYDLTGKLIQEFRNENLIFQTDISAFVDGIYTIRFSFEGNVIYKRFVVQK